MNNRRRMTGVVTSDKMTKTVVVEISRTYQHPLYKKVVHAHSHFKAHNELDAQLGDIVVIVESRPLSRDKRWVVEKIVRRQGEAAVTEMVVEDAVVEAPADVSPVSASSEGETFQEETPVEPAPADEGTGSETVEADAEADATTTETVEGE